MSEKVTDLRAYFDTNDTLAYTNVGTSMMPLLHEGKDVIILKKSPPPYHRYDVVLYVRDSGEYVLHRVLKVLKNSKYILSGDHTTYKEIVDETQIIAVLDRVQKSDGKEVKTTDKRYRFYSHLWSDFYPVRCVIIKAKYHLKALAKKPKKQK